MYNHIAAASSFTAYCVVQVTWPEVVDGVVLVGSAFIFGSAAICMDYYLLSCRAVVNTLELKNTQNLAKVQSSSVCLTVATNAGGWLYHAGMLCSIVCVCVVVLYYHGQVMQYAVIILCSSFIVLQLPAFARVLS